MKQSITFSCTEQNTVWNNKTVIEHAINALNDNPFATIVEMDFDLNGKWESFNKEKAIDTLAKKDRVVSFRDSTGFLDASISKHKLVNKLRLEVLLEREQVKIETLLAFYQKLAEALPAFEKGDAVCDMPVREIYEKFDIEYAPPCFTSQLGWAHIISPRGYSKYFTKEELLVIPDVFFVQEKTNGNILIQFYEHPFDYDKPGNIEKIKKAVRYLNQTRRDWKEED